jgi:hypothetical protein
MSWTTSTDLRTQVQRLWDRGDLLRACVSPAIAWPLRLSLKTPSPSDLSDRFEQARRWAGELASTPHVRIDWRDWTHRVQGRQRLPAAVMVDDLDNALAIVGKGRAAERFIALWQQTEGALPTLLPWLTRRPLDALDAADRWDRLLATVGWIRAHPRPGVYLRQVDALGVDTKFIEAHRGLLTEWLDLVLPQSAIDTAASGVGQFVQRYGFQAKPVRIRFRLLDAALPSLPGCRGLADITLDATSFAALNLPLQWVFITENETNFLAFPRAQQAIVLFGAGYGWEPLSRATWLHSCHIHYWGDIDTHGFAILDQLRGHFPRVTSFLMDRETLFAHRLQWGEEAAPVQHGLSRLSAAEAALYDEIRFDRIQPKLRLEQERVGQHWLTHGLAGALLAATDAPA